MKKIILVLCGFTLIIFIGCSSGIDEKLDKNSVILTLGAYTVPKDAYQKEIIPAFKKIWKEKTGQKVQFQESYIASGAQSRTIASGFEADIAALSLEKDVQRLVEKGLITHDWKKKKYNGFVTRSVVVMAYRPGNPLNVKDWQDLTREDVEVVYPSPKTSGGAMWFVNAVYGSVLKESELKTGEKNFVAARNRLKNIQRQVKVMDKSGRSSVTTFESGIGDVLLTYENEALLRQKQGKEFPYIIPSATIMIENPIALIDRNVDKHGNRKVAEAFVEFVLTESAQRSFARFGFRPVDEKVLDEFSDQYPEPVMLFDILYLGGWDRVFEEIYSSEGVWSQIILELANEK